MALNLKNYQESQNKSMGSNINGHSPKNAPIGIHSYADALKNVTIGIDSKAMNGSTQNPLSRKRPLPSPYQLECKAEDDVVNLKNNSDEEKPDLELTLKTQQLFVDIKQETLNNSSSTFGQIRPLCVCSGAPSPNNPIREPKAEENEAELICLGCRYCYIYVLVPSDNPTCPKCLKNKYLIEIPGGNPIKRAKMN